MRRYSSCLTLVLSLLWLSAFVDSDVCAGAPGEPTGSLITMKQFYPVLISGICCLERAVAQSQGAEASGDLKDPGPREARATTTPAAAEKRRIIFFGDSLTGGHALPRSQAYPAVIQEQLQGEDLPYIAINSGISGDTSGDGLSRVADDLSEPVAIFILALGANDAGRGLSVSSVEENLQGILDLVRAANPAAKLVIGGVASRAFMSPARSREFEDMYRRLAAKNKAVLVVNILAGVADRTDLMMSDGMHPNSLGHRAMAKTFWRSLRPLLSK